MFVLLEHVETGFHEHSSGGNADAAETFRQRDDVSLHA
ncbi:MAG: hypothetical protein QOE55_6569 [Acidobacteriaceae bacterium]|jgi:hypothetical protein|nr:hypothetical protein [Acidobacteriaceae bacterium]